MKLGVVVGKFSPLHLGHEWMIKEAAKQCDKLFIVSYSNPELEGCEAVRRQQWLNTRFPHITSVVIPPDHQMPLNTASDDEQQQYFGRVLRDLNYGAHVLFCSEAWGHACAEVLSKHLGHKVNAVILDVDRTIVPVSGTKIREAPGKYAQYMSKEVNDTFIRRIVLLGGESCGKTTLAQALAKHFDTSWVPEYGREMYVQQNGVLTQENLTTVARVQIEHEKYELTKAKRYLFCDTSPLTTSAYSMWMFNRIDPKLAALAKRQYHGAIFCSPDIPFVQDGTRSSNDFRMDQHEWYKSVIPTLKYPVLEVSGSVDERMSSVIKWLDGV